MAFDDFDRKISTALFARFGKAALFVSGQAPGVPVSAIVHYASAQFADQQERASIASVVIDLQLSEVPKVKRGDRIVVGSTDYTWESELERDDVIVKGRVRVTSP